MLKLIINISQDEFKIRSEQVFMNIDGSELLPSNK